MTRLSLLLVLPLTLLFTGCATSDPERPAQSISFRGEALPSRWEGQWKSAKHRGMNGRLRCFLTKIDNRHYRAQFRANWLAFTSSYAVVLETGRAGDGLRLNGTHQLRGIGGGLYHYEGKVTKSRFTASYDSNYDTGTFVMTPALN